MIITPKKDGDRIDFGKESVYVKDVIGLNPDDFLEIFEGLRACGLTLSNIHFPVGKTFFDRKNKKIIPFSIVRHLLEFVVLCRDLKKQGFKISKLINEFNKAQKQGIDKVRHDVSLARVCYEYLIEGYDVKIFPRRNNKKNPDLKINELYADVKVRRDPDTMEWVLKYLKTSKFEPNIGYLFHFKPIEERQKDLYQAQKSLLDKGFNQADVFFWDLSYRTFSWSYSRWQDSSAKSKPIELKKKRVIIFSYNKQIRLEQPKIKWTHFDWDSLNSTFL